MTGDRNWSDRYLLSAVLYGFMEIAMKSWGEPLTVIEGGARGADEAARDWVTARRLDDMNVELVTVNADWDKHGKAAGPLRNIKMLDEHDPELVLAFHNDLEQSKGTKHCVGEAKKRGLLIYHFTSEH